MPYLMDLCPLTFELIDEILTQICNGMEVKSDWPPPLEKECMAVTTLNLLNLQVSGTQLHCRAGLDNGGPTVAKIAMENLCYHLIAR